MVPSETALVSFYRSSIVTFPLSLRVSEILPLLFSSMSLFPYPTSSLPQISPCSPGIRWIAFWLQRAKVLWLIDRAISFQDFQPMWSQITHVTDGQMDRRHAIARPLFALCIVHRAVKIDISKGSACSDTLSYKFNLSWLLLYCILLYFVLTVQVLKIESVSWLEWLAV